ncbi:hypothetical protein ACHAW5_008820 [Stephanodiscus triporus]|uniref:Uncharacterized protein n=1 Tax=Stephanodiscus triporus TaxID=2934178 RepID=A0ABD3MYA9_9STRA
MARCREWFDAIIVNDDLDDACSEFDRVVEAPDVPATDRALIFMWRRETTCLGGG